MTYRIIPTYTESLQDKGITSSAWYRWINGMHQGIPPAAEVSVIVKASPFTYVAPLAGNLIVNGGTVASIQFNRTTGKNYTTGQTSGMFNLSLGDSLIITYSVIPTLTFVPT
jgi:hypothetical protein